MNFLRRLKETAESNLETYGANAYLLTLRQKLSPFLKKELSPSQLSVKCALSLSLTNLEFDEAALNELLTNAGVRVRKLTVKRVDIDLSAIRCDMSGLDLVLSGALAPPRPSRGTPVSSAGVESNENQDPPSGGALAALTSVLTEVLELVDHCLCVSIADLTIHLELPAGGAQDFANLGNAITLSIRIPHFLYRDSTGELYNDLPETLSSSSETNKVVTLSAFDIALDGSSMCSSRSTTSIGLRLSRRESKIVCHLGDVNLSMRASQLIQLSAVSEAIANLQESRDTCGSPAILSSQLPPLETSAEDGDQWYDCDDGDQDMANEEQKHSLTSTVEEPAGRAGVFSVEFDFTRDVSLGFVDDHNEAKSGLLCIIGGTKVCITANNIQQKCLVSAREVEGLLVGRERRVRILHLFGRDLSHSSEPLEISFEQKPRGTLGLRVACSLGQLGLHLDHQEISNAMGLFETIKQIVLQDHASEGEMLELDVDFSAERFVFCSYFATTKTQNGCSSLVFEIGPLKATLSTCSSSAESPLGVIWISIKESRLVAEGDILVSLSEMCVTTSPPEEGDLLLDRLFGREEERARAWEPASSEERETGSLGDSLSGGFSCYDWSVRKLWVSVSDVTVNITKENLQAFKDHVTSLAEMAPPTKSLIAPEATHIAEPSLERHFSVCFVSTSTVITMHSSEKPMIRVTANNILQTISSRTGKSRLLIRELKVLYLSPEQDWISILERSPRVRSKPDQNQDMIVLDMGEESVKLRLACMLLRFPQWHFWLDEKVVSEVTAFSRILDAVGADRDAAPCRLTVFVKAEDVFVETSGPVHKSERSGDDATSQAVLEITRLSLGTVVIVPTPPLQQYTFTADHVGLLFSKKSHRLSAQTEAEGNFVKFMVLPGVSALALNVMVSREEPQIRMSVEVLELSLSACSDTLAAAQEHFSSLVHIDPPVQQRDAHIDVVEIKVEDQKQEAAKHIDVAENAEGSESRTEARGSKAVNADRAEQLELLPCIEDYFFDRADLDEQPQDDVHSSESQLNGGADEGESDEWVIDGFLDGQEERELAQWSVSSNAHDCDGSSPTGGLGDFSLHSARWFSDPAPELLPHHVPVPVKESWFETKSQFLAVFDLNVSVNVFKCRLFDGSDWKGPSSRVAAKKTQQNLHRNTLLDDRSPIDKIPKQTRNQNRVVEVSINGLLLRYSQGDQRQYMKLETDFSVSCSLDGTAQNCLYEWKKWRQAHEELNANGERIRMLSFEFLASVPSETDPIGVCARPREEYCFSITFRPLRCCATWDLVDFVRSFLSAMSGPTGPTKSSTESGRNVEWALLVKSASIQPVALKIDFDTRLIDLEAVRRGDMWELLKLFPLKDVELMLRPISSTNSTINSFSSSAMQTWVEDITSSQLHKFAAGAGPIRPISKIGHKAANVILLPLEQYRQGGRVLWGLRRGAVELTHTLALESVQFSSKLSRFLASSFRYLADSPSNQSQSSRRGEEDSQPPGVHAGLAQARGSLCRGVNIAAHAIIVVPMEGYQRDSTKGAIKAAIRAVPVAILAPVIGATEALSYTLLGIRNALSPDTKFEEDAKYRRGSRC